MSNQQYPDSGWINENSRKTSDSQPDWRGTISVSPELAAAIARDGKVDIAAWNKPAGQYGKTMSAKITVAWKKPDAATPSSAAPPAAQKKKLDSFDDDLPF